MTTPKPPSPAERIGATTPIGETKPATAAPAPEQTFQSYMQKTAGAAPTTPTQSPFDLAHGTTTLTAGPTFDTLLQQSQSAQNTLGGIQNQLKTPNLKLKASSKYLLKNKLSDADAHLRSANAKVGGKEIPPQIVPPGSSPITQFLALVTDGQNQLQGAQTQLQSLKDKGENLNPAELMLVQIKLNKAQQELEYSSILLSKAVDDMKMLFNINL